MLQPTRCKPLALVVTMIALLATATAVAEALSPRAQIEARQSNFKDLGGAFKTLRDQLRRSSPDLISIEQAAQSVKELSHDQAVWFPKGTGPETGIKTDAKPEIWSDSAGFVAANKKLAEESAKLYAVALAKDIEGIKANVLVVGQACKGCHDKYRVPRD